MEKHLQIILLHYNHGNLTASYIRQELMCDNHLRFIPCEVSICLIKINPVYLQYLVKVSHNKATYQLLR